MLFIYGDSHGRISFKGLPIPVTNCSINSVTMFRIGRDNMIINYNKTHDTENSTHCLVYGEIDCRCHIHKQVHMMGRNEDDVIHELVHTYFRTLKNSITVSKRVIVVGVIPPTKRIDYESKHGPLEEGFPFPFLGTDEERVRYTRKVNRLIEELCQCDGYAYFNPYAPYTSDDGTLRYELSDTFVHVGDNTAIVEQFMCLYEERGWA